MADVLTNQLRAEHAKLMQLLVKVRHALGSANQAGLSTCTVMAYEK